MIIPLYYVFPKGTFSVKPAPTIIFKIVSLLLPLEFSTSHSVFVFFLNLLLYVIQSVIIDYLFIPLSCLHVGKIFVLFTFVSSQYRTVPRTQQMFNNFLLNGRLYTVQKLTQCYSRDTCIYTHILKYKNFYTLT